MDKFSIRKRWLEKIEKNNVTIVLNVSYAKKEKIYCVYVSKCNSNCEKQGILLLISKREKRKASLQSPQDIGIILH